MNDDQVVSLIAAILLSSQVLREDDVSKTQSFGYSPDLADIKNAVKTARYVLDETRSRQLL